MGPAERILCEHRGSSVTLGRLRESRDTCAAAMEKAGVGAGDAVVAVLGSKPNTIAAMFAAWSIGAAFAPLDPHMSPYLARRFLDTVVPTVVLAGDEPAPVLPDGAGVVQPAGDDHLDWDVDSSASAGTPRPQVTALPKSEVALDLGVIDTAGGVVAISVPAADLGRTVSTIPDDLGGDCRIGTFSLDTWAGIVDVLTAVRGNHRLVLCSPFSPSEFRKSVKRHSARTASLTTQSMAMLLEDPDAEDLEPLETIRFASAHLPIPLVRRFHRQFGVNVAAGYGNRQFGREVLGWDATDLRRHGSGKVGSTGRPRPGVEVALVDDSGAPLPEGRVGELVFPGHGRPEEGHTQPSGPRHAVDRLDRRAQLGIDAGAQEALTSIGRVHDHVALLGPKRTGRAQEEAVEQPTEQEEEHDEEGERCHRGPEPTRSTLELSDGQPHRSAPDVAVASTGCSRRTRRIAPTEANPARPTTMTATPATDRGSTEASRPAPP
ncbi:MAG: hypothetical protein DYH08_03755, partial [Actinobacteria bacterium ATB1]|nr:hypothetical protein [Actinobacteria bacterium ATB1]